MLEFNLLNLCRGLGVTREEGEGICIKGLELARKEFGRLEFREGGHVLLDGKSGRVR